MCLGDFVVEKKSRGRVLDFEYGIERGQSWIQVVG